MSTTALVIEHLIIGLQSAIWISLLILSAFGWEWIDVATVKDLSSFIAFLGLATIYPIGIFVDELADYVFKDRATRIRKKRIQQEGADANRMEITAVYVLQHSSDEYLKSYFSYIRMRIRVSRSTAINLVLITFSGLIFSIVRLNHIAGFKLLIFFVIFLGFLSTMLAIWVWMQVSDTFAKQIVRASKSMSATSSPTP